MCERASVMSTCKCETAVIFTHSPALTRLTGGRWRRGAALVSELLQRVDGHVEVDVLAATPLIHQLLLLEGLNPSQITSSRTPSVRTGWDRRPATVCRGCAFVVPAERRLFPRGKT